MISSHQPAPQLLPALNIFAIGSTHLAKSLPIPFVLYKTPTLGEIAWVVKKLSEMQAWELFFLPQKYQLLDESVLTAFLRSVHRIPQITHTEADSVHADLLALVHPNHSGPCSFGRSDSHAVRLRV